MLKASESRKKSHWKISPVKNHPVGGKNTRGMYEKSPSMRAHFLNT